MPGNENTYTTMAQLAASATPANAPTLAHQLAAPIEAEFAASDSSSSSSDSNNSKFANALTPLWDAITSTARRTPHASQDGLVALVLALRARGFLSSERESELGGLESWKELPWLGAQMREEWNVVPQTSQEWTNINAFAARLTALNEAQECQTLDYVLYAIWTLRDVFEEERDGGVNEETKVAAAAVWFLYAGARLRACCTAEKAFEGKMARPGSRFREEGKAWKGFCVERWGVWAEGLKGVLEGGVVLGEEAKELLEKAVGEMERVIGDGPGA